MSQWTHFIGTIQYNGNYDDALKALGKPILWNDAKQLEYGTPQYKDYYTNVWRAAFKNFEAGQGIPMGSEGSINWKFSDTSVENENVLGEGALIAIEGDLRDFGENDDEINRSIAWFEKACQQLYARDAVLKIDVEFGPVLVIEWDGEKVRRTELRTWEWRND